MLNIVSSRHSFIAKRPESGLLGMLNIVSSRHLNPLIQTGAVC